jgi:hypothetical protein
MDKKKKQNCYFAVHAIKQQNKINKANEELQQKLFNRYYKRFSQASSPRITINKHVHCTH